MLSVAYRILNGIFPSLKELLVINARSHMLTLTLMSLWVLSLASFTSTTLLALSHVFIALPAFYFLFKGSDRSMSRSMWMLFSLSVIILLSVAFNAQMDRAVRNAFKVKYFVFGLLSIFAFREFFKSEDALEKMKWPFRLLLITTSVAAVSGLIGLYTGYNPLRFAVATDKVRNGGLFGMIMTYAYGLSLYLICLISFWYHRRDLLYRWVPAPWFALGLLINLIGLYFSFTRGAYLGLLFALPFILFKKHTKKSLVTLSVTLLLGVTAFFTVTQVKDHFTRKGSDAKRIALFKAAVMAGQEKPILGYGYRNLEPNVGDIKKRYGIAYPNMNGHAHNNFLEHLGSTGIPGALAFFLFTVLWAWEMFKREDIIGEVGLVFVVSFTISGLFQYTFGDAANVFFIMGVYALTQVYPKTNFFGKVKSSGSHESA